MNVKPSQGLSDTYHPLAHEAQPGCSYALATRTAYDLHLCQRPPKPQAVQGQDTVPFAGSRSYDKPL